MRHFVFLIAIFVSLIPDLRAAEPFFKPNDVVALVGGEDMVVAAELGYLETLIQLALPDHHLKFRSLAREGDTVFEQRRDLNYPKLEDQLDKIGATVVICQFGQMESLMAMGDAPKDKRDEKDAKDKKDAGKAEVPLVPSVPSVPEKADATRKAKVAEFVVAYEKLIGRLSVGGKRRMVIISPTPIARARTATSNAEPDDRNATDFLDAIVALADKQSIRFINTAHGLYVSLHTERGKDYYGLDGVHLTANGQAFFATQVAALAYAGQYGVDVPNRKTGEFGGVNPDGTNFVSKLAALRQLIAAKNRLWYYYYRPQNWAFLAGDRTNQPSSRDHLDPSKRWFPEELEKFVPLIDAKDAEIWALAKKLSK